MSIMVLLIDILVFILLLFSYSTFKLSHLISKEEENDIIIK